MAGLYITIGILIAVVLFIVFPAVRPKLKRYQFSIKKIEPKKRHIKPIKKKKKSVWIKVI